MVSVVGGATGEWEARAATSIARDDRGRGKGWNEEVKGGSAWRGGARRGEGRSQQRRVKADPTEDVAADSEATGGGDRGDDGGRRGGMAAVCHAGVLARGYGGGGGISKQ